MDGFSRFYVQNLIDTSRTIPTSHRSTNSAALCCTGHPRFRAAHYLSHTTSKVVCHPCNTKAAQQAQHPPLPSQHTHDPQRGAHLWMLLPRQFSLPNSLQWITAPRCNSQALDPIGQGKGSPESLENRTTYGVHNHSAIFASDRSYQQSDRRMGEAHVHELFVRVGELFPVAKESTVSSRVPVCLPCLAVGPTVRILLVTYWKSRVEKGQ